MKKFTINDASKSELESIIRVCTAFISGLNMRHITMQEAHEIFKMPDYKAALRLGLTVSTKGMYHYHDLDCQPITKLIAECMNKSKSMTIDAFYQLRDIAKSTLRTYESN